MLQLEALIETECLNGIFVVEHWLSQPELETVHLAQFNLVSGYCRPPGCHGGSSIFSDNRPAIKTLDLGKYVEDRVCEVSGMRYGGIHFFVIYRPPSGDFIRFLNKLTTLLEDFAVCSILCIGDFNVHFNSNA